MKKTKSGKILVSLLCVIALCIPALASDPGSLDDPLVTLSYVNDVLLPQVKSYVDTTISASNGEGGADYSVVNVSKGQMILGGKSCHMIMRMGTGTIVATEKGGVADVTVGIDLANGTAAPSNHLLIIPVDDGRGIKMTSDGILMISGKYSVAQ